MRSAQGPRRFAISPTGAYIPRAAGKDSRPFPAPWPLEPDADHYPHAEPLEGQEDMDLHPRTSLGLPPGPSPAARLYTLFPA